MRGSQLHTSKSRAYEEFDYIGEAEAHDEERGRRFVEMYVMDSFTGG
jgi:hypothetical protein